MKLKGLTIIEYTQYSKDMVNGKYPVKLAGTVEFEGKSGTMKFELSEQDFTDIAQLLANKCKVLAEEA